MTWYDPRTWGKKTVDVDGALLPGSYNDIDWSADNYWALSREGMEACSTVYTCINRTAIVGATIPLASYQGDDRLDRQVEILDRLKRPNKIMGYSAFIRYWIQCMQLGGRAYIWNNKSEFSGDSLELWPVPPNDVTVNHSTTIWGLIDSFTIDMDGTPKTVPAEDMMYTWYHHPRDFMEPLSPMKAAAREVDLENEGLGWNVQLMGNQSKPPMGIAPKESENPLTDKQAKELEKAIIAKIGGKGGAGKPLVFRWPMDIQEFGWSPNEMEWLKGLREMDRRIANVYNFPAELLGIEKTYENFEVAERVFYEQAVLPLMELFATEISVWEASDLEAGQEVRVERGKIDALKDDQEALSTMLSDQVRHGRRTPNEARTEMGQELSPDKAADMLYIDKNIVPLALSGADMFNEGEPE